MHDDEARRRFAPAPVARLATSDADGQPHVVPICFVLLAATIYFAIDDKPKRTQHLKRLTNLAANPRASVLVDHFDAHDWNALWWVRADGTGRVLAEAEADDDDDGDGERTRAIDGLRAKYPQYRGQPLDRPVVAIDVRRWASWEAATGTVRP
jgi:PPOX class probable F420-dependent enzyme